MYDIGGIIKFRSEDGAIFIKNESEHFTKLNATMTRLLIYLLQRQGQVCLREEIFENVWDVYGLSSSNNSLNKYISDLRKMFISYGFTDDFIKTIPRIGFIVSSDVDIKIYSEVNGVKSSGEASLNSNKWLFNKKLDNKYLKMILLFVIAHVFIIFLAHKNFFSDIATNTEITFASELPIGKIDGCKIALVNGKKEQINDIKKNVISDIIIRKKITCSQNSILYVFISESVLFEHKGRVFISKCNISNDSVRSHSSCKSFYEADYAKNN